MEVGGAAAVLMVGRLQEVERVGVGVVFDGVLLLAGRLVTKLVR